MNQYPDDHYHLERFVEAQNPVYDQVCWELQQGLKMTHWMWFIFPQIEGLSSSRLGPIRSSHITGNHSGDENTTPHS